MAYIYFDVMLLFGPTFSVFLSVFHLSLCPGIARCFFGKGDRWIG